MVARLFPGELAGLGRDSGLLGVARAAEIAGALAQVALVSHVLGLREFGRLTLALAFVTLVQQFFDFRVGPATVTFGAQAGDDPRAAAAVIQFGYLVDGATGVLGFLTVAALSPLVGPSLIGDQGTILLLLLSLTLLSSTVDTTSAAVLQIYRGFRVLAGYAAAKEIVRIAALALALALGGSLVAVVVALLVNDVIAAIGIGTLAARRFRATHAVSLRRPALRSLGESRRPMLRMIFNTNVVGYGRLAQVQLPPLLIGAFHGPIEAGLYKVGMTIATGMGSLGDPPRGAALSRLSRLWHEGKRDEIRHLVRRSTLVAAPLLAIVAATVILLRVPLLGAVGGAEARAAASILVLGVIAHAVNAALFWNGPLMMAARGTVRLSVVAVAGVLAQIPLLFLVVPRHGATGAAWVFLAVYVLQNAWVTRIALRILGRENARA